MDAEHEFNFGELRKALTEEQQTVLESGPKNLGQVIKAAHQSEGQGPDAADEAASTGLEKAREKFAAHAAEGDGPQGHGPPASGRAQGRNGARLYRLAGGGRLARRFFVGRPRGLRT